MTDICTTSNIELFANYNGKEESFAFSVTRCISHTTNQKEKEDRSRVIQLDRGGDENSSFPPSQTGSRKRAPSALFWCFKPVPHTHTLVFLLFNTLPVHVLASNLLCTYKYEQKRMYT